jgi:spore cortex biosynthesis protein YabQ
MGLAAGYESLRLLRVCIPHNSIWIGVEDLLFWVLTGLLLFTMILNENNGKVRWYALAGSGAGACVYGSIIHPILRWILHPVWIFAGKYGRIVEKLLKKARKFVTLKTKGMKSKTSDQEAAEYGGLFQKKEKKKKPFSHAGHHSHRTGPDGGSRIPDQGTQQEK